MTARVLGVVNLSHRSKYH